MPRHYKISLPTANVVCELNVALLAFKLQPYAFIFSFISLFRTHFRQASKLSYVENKHFQQPGLLFYSDFFHTLLHPHHPPFHFLYLKILKIHNCWLRGLDAIKQMSLLSLFFNISLERFFSPNFNPLLRLQDLFFNQQSRAHFYFQHLLVMKYGLFVLNP